MFFPLLLLGMFFILQRFGMLMWEESRRRGISNDFEIDLVLSFPFFTIRVLVTEFPLNRYDLHGIYMIYLHILLVFLMIFSFNGVSTSPWMNCKLSVMFDYGALYLALRINKHDVLLSCFLFWVMLMMYKWILESTF